ncbi:mediator of RNA polymerase II transcription subunit 15-like [Thrips palmi]|uniref:Mediator of RNA polymerase II transcription subunit 15-like n=1 Tax=Thrips palmi TaxID=161013 RepID=A0A6P8ZHZ1_THRPL|nr:mediator of RNA polymerase II transcription subunit 15-like [Thrips palmi]
MECEARLRLDSERGGHQVPAEAQAESPEVKTAVAFASPKPAAPSTDVTEAAVVPEVPSPDAKGVMAPSPDVKEATVPAAPSPDVKEVATVPEAPSPEVTVVAVIRAAPPVLAAGLGAPPTRKRNALAAAFGQGPAGNTRRQRAAQRAKLAASNTEEGS